LPSDAPSLLATVRVLLPPGYTVEATASANGYRIGRAVKTGTGEFDSRSRILEIAAGWWQVFRSAGRPTKGGPHALKLDGPVDDVARQIVDLARKERVLPTT
jgi:hypothetical protein